MWALLNVACAEFFKAFRRKSGTPAAHDFAWLTVFFILSAFLVFLGFSASQGIWERFEQVLLGALPNSGPPVRVSYHADRPAKITADLIGAFERRFPDLSIVPMRDFDGRSGTIVLPGLATELAAKKSEGESGADKAFSWGSSSDGREVELRSYAMALNAPIWQWVFRRYGSEDLVRDQPYPLVIAASYHLFSQHFRYEKYRNKLLHEHRVPCALRRQLPESISSPRDLKFLVLEVKEGRNRFAYHPFNVIWVDSFPLPEQVAFVLPLSTVELLIAAEQRRGLQVHPESGGRASSRIQKLALKDIDVDPSGVAEFRKIAACLGAISTEEKPETSCPLAKAPSEDARLEHQQLDEDNRIVPRLIENELEVVVAASAAWPLRQADIKYCAAAAGVGDIFDPANPLAKRLRIEPTATAPSLQWRGPARVSVPCRTLIKNDREAGRNRTVRCFGPRYESIRGIAWLDGYRDAMIYTKAREGSTPGVGGLFGTATTLVGARPATADAGKAPSAAATSSGGNLDEIVRSLLEWRPGGGHPVFRLDAAYESALVRFGVLSALIQHISRPLAFGSTLLYLALCAVMLATTFMHRRAQYGLLAMIGVSRLQIDVIVYTQIMLASVIGCILGFLGYLLAAWAVNSGLAGSEVIAKAAAIIGLDVPTFLGELSIVQAVTIAGVMTLVNMLVGLAVLWTLGIARAKAPIDLIKS